MVHWLLPSTLLLLEFAYADADAPCYLPNGIPASGFFACDPTAYITSCCPTGWTCYSNSMCVVTDPSTANSSHPLGTSIRGSCTNPEWNNAVCGDFCLTDRDLGGDLKACGDNKFCCADDSECSCAKGAFHLNPGRAQTIIGIEGLEHTETSTVPPSTSSAYTSSSSPLNTAVRTPTSTGNQAPIPTTQSTGNKLKPGEIAGIVVGVIIAVGLIAGALCFKCRRNFLGSRWRTRDNVGVQPTSAPPRPISTQDPYRRGNAANMGLDPPVTATTSQSGDNFDRGDAPFDNAYERDTPSRNAFMNSTTTVGTGIPNDSYNGMRGFGGRPLSWVTDEGETRYERPRANGFGL